MQHFFPEIGGAKACGVRRIAGAVFVAAVEGEKPTVFAFEGRAHGDGVFVEGEVHSATFGSEEDVFGVALVALILYHGIGSGLSGDFVFEFEGHHGKSVDEDGEVDGESGTFGVEMELSHHGEDVFAVALFFFGGIEDGESVVEIEGITAVSDSVAQHFDDALFV